jgi:nicotinamide phosphoribosyltransferase
MEPNILLLTDSYKPSHWKQLPDGTTILHSYLESRGGKFDNTLFFGLQYLIKKYLQGKVVTLSKINRAKLFWDAHLGPGIFNLEGWMHILDKHDGHLPVKIKAVPEGTVVPTGNVLLTIENTDPEVPWLTNYLETLILQIWYPITVGTLSREVKKVLIKYLKKTTTHDTDTIRSIVNFMLHDFGFRGVSSVESAGIGAAAHIINFRGTDTVEGILLAQEYYNTVEMLAFSIPASEHSTITSWTEPYEVRAFENMLDKFPTGLVACVSDSFDIIRACRDHWGTTLREKVLNRDGRLVIRPDSGDPVQTLKQVFNVLWDRFGGTINSKGFKVLDPHVRVIQGDGVNYESIIEILDMMIEEGFSVENIAFGMGGALLQKVDRDTQKFAIKCSSIVINGEEVDVQKNPIEINEFGERVQSFKKSKAGRMKLVHKGVTDYNNSDEYETVTKCSDFSDDIMVDIFENGKILKEWTFQEVRERAEIEFEEFIYE